MQEKLLYILDMCRSLNSFVIKDGKCAMCVSSISFGRALLLSLCEFTFQVYLFIYFLAGLHIDPQCVNHPHCPRHSVL